MFKVVCNHCGKEQVARFTGTVWGTPNNWWAGRQKPWPKPSLGEIHVCSDSCKQEIVKEGHKNLWWKKFSFGLTARENIQVESSVGNVMRKEVIKLAAMKRKSKENNS